MRKQSYATWCAVTQARLEGQDPDAAEAYARSVRSACDVIDATSAVAMASTVDTVMRTLRGAYADLLASLHQQHYEMLQPGMLLAPLQEKTAKNIAEQLTFVPLPDRIPRTHPVWRQCEQAFDRYKAEKVKPFVRRLRKCTHQLVLVDLFRVLRIGRPAVVNDLADCLAEVLDAFHYSDSRLRRMAGKIPGITPGVRRVVLAASKADHATVDFRSNLSCLLSEAVVKAAAKPGNNLAEHPPNEYFASLRATEDGLGKIDGKPLAVLRGRRKGADEEKNLFPGRVPQAWPNRPFPNTFDEFEPKPVPGVNSQPWPHLHLDNLLWTLLKDAL